MKSKLSSFYTRLYRANFHLKHSLSGCIFSGFWDVCEIAAALSDMEKFWLGAMGEARPCARMGARMDTVLPGVDLVGEQGGEIKMERDTGIEPAASSLGSWHSTN